jgi:SAM-dependent methyltransferase
MENWYFKSFQVYQSPHDLIRWLKWFRPEQTVHYLPDDRVTALADASERESRRVLTPFLNGSYEFRIVDVYNAIDFLLQNLYPVPERMRPKRVLDFGPGYGRQLNLWSRVEDITYVAMDAIELPYTLQSFYLTQFGLPTSEYTKGDNISIGAAPGIYHLPTWRADLLPDAFFDLVICTQVLTEIPPTMVNSAIQTFRRCVKPGGAVYIRDHGLAPELMHDIDVDAVLSSNGFTLEFRPYIIDTHWEPDDQTGLAADIHGIPRMFRRIDSRYPRRRRNIAKKVRIIKKKVRRAVSEADLRWGGVLHRLIKKRRTR